MKTIVWDLDDVLNDFTVAWLANGWKAEHPECGVAFEDLRSNPPITELRTSREVYLESLDRFRSSGAARQLQPQREVFEWFQRIGSEFRHHVLTARPVKTVAPAAEWVFTHFGKWVRDFHFVPSPRPEDVLPHYETGKGEVLARLGKVDFFVDDSPVNVAEAANLGIHGFIFPQPWNRSQLTASGILHQISRFETR